MWQRVVPLCLVANKNSLRLATVAFSAIVFVSAHFRFKIYIYLVYLHGISLLKLIPSSDAFTWKPNLNQ